MPRRKPEIKNSGILWDHICHKILFHNYMEDHWFGEGNPPSFGINPRSEVGEKMSKKFTRSTKETKIKTSVKIYGNGKAKINTGIQYLNHMLEIFSHHSLLDLELNVKGDTHVDLHHTVEDTAYVIAQGIIESLGNKKGINRFGYFILIGA